MSTDRCFTDGCGRPATARTDEGAPICADCHGTRIMRRLDGPSKPSPDDGVIHRGHIFAAGSDGKRHAGAVPVWYRPPQRAQDAHHDQEIEINRRIEWQQAPPVYCHGATVMDSPREARRKAREITEAEAQRAEFKSAAHYVNLGDVRLTATQRRRLRGLRGRVG